MNGLPTFCPARLDVRAPRWSRRLTPIACSLREAYGPSVEQLAQAQRFLRDVRAALGLVARGLFVLAGELAPRGVPTRGEATKLALRRALVLYQASAESRATLGYALSGVRS